MAPRARAWTLYLARVAALAAAYVGLGKLGLVIDPADGFAALVWPPTGLSLAALLLAGSRLWPGVAIGAFVVNAWAGAPLLVATAMAAGNTLEALIGYHVLRRATPSRNPLCTLRGTLALILIAAPLGASASAAIGVVSLLAGGIVPRAHFTSTWCTWWLGDLTSALVVAPAILAWGGALRGPVTRRAIIESSVMVLSVVAVSAFVFLDLPLATSWAPGMAYMLFPPIIWTAIRFGPRGAGTVMLLATALAITGTVLGRGPFVLPVMFQGLVGLQKFIAIVAATSAILGAVVSERRQVEEALRTAREDLETKVQRRTEELGRGRRELETAQRIAQVGSWEWDLATNRVRWTEELYRIYAVPPEQVSRTYEDFLACVHPDDREFVKGEVARSLRDRVPLQFEHRVIHPDGSVRVVEGRGQVQVDARGVVTGMAGTSLDITLAKERERQIQASLKEKELLLREMHHRVKNNLQIVSSLLSLQARDVTDPALRTVLEECDSRIRAIALVHERLHKEAGMTSIDLDGYVRSLVDTLVRTYGVNGDKVAVDVAVERFALGIDGAVPCGLIVNELVSNALKHAFPGDRRGRISVTLRLDPGKDHLAVMEVADDGIGLPANVDLRSPPTLGLKLVTALARQLGGALELENDAGARFRIRFPALPR